MSLSTAARVPSQITSANPIRLTAKTEEYQTIRRRRIDMDLFRRRAQDVTDATNRVNQSTWNSFLSSNAGVS